MTLFKSPAAKTLAMLLLTIIYGVTSLFTGGGHVTLTEVMGIVSLAVGTLITYLVKNYNYPDWPLPGRPSVRRTTRDPRL
jgi:hypothetical protein